jgi:disulfide bond formation protein DsbB
MKIGETMNMFLARYLLMPRAAQILLAACVSSLGFALVMQYGFGFDPCILCLWQRGPFVAGGLLALLALAWKPYGKQSCIILGVIVFVFLINAGIAAFHTGVERHWWLGTTGCTVTPLHAKTPDSILQELLSTPVAHCDEISWTLFGLSMANYNIPFSLGLAVFALLAGLKISSSHNA